MQKQGWLGQVPLRRLGAAGVSTVTDATFATALAAPQTVLEFWSPT